MDEVLTVEEGYLKASGGFGSVEAMPIEIHEKWGFGMAPPKRNTMVERRAAVRRVLELVAARSLPVGSAETFDALSTTKGMFTRIYKEDQWDWFTVMGQLGYPSRDLAKAISEEISHFRSALRDGLETDFRTSQTNLHRLPARKCLKVFLGDLVIREEAEAGWLYVLSNREYRDLLKIGMTTRSVELRAAEINQATGVAIPFGVRRCWRVRNPAAVERAAHASLSDARVRGDREFFRIDFFEAARRLNVLMKEGGYEIRTLGNLSSLAGEP